MKKVIYSAVFLFGLFMAIAESSTTATNVIGLAVMLAVSAKVGLINLKDILNK